MQDNYFTTETLKAALQAKGINTNDAAKPVIDAMISKGAIIQGINDQKTTPTPVTTPASTSIVDTMKSPIVQDTVKEIGAKAKENLINPFTEKLGKIDYANQNFMSNGLQTVGGIVGGGFDVLLNGLKGAYQAVTPENIQQGVQAKIEQGIAKVADAIDPKYLEEMSAMAKAHPEIAGDLNAILNIGLPKGIGSASKVLEDAVRATEAFKTAKAGAGAAVDATVQGAKDATGAVVDNLVTKPLDAMGNLASDVKNKVTDTTKKGVDAMKSSVDEALLSPTADEAAKNNLNPFIANVAEVSIPVKSEGGVTKYILKNAKDATPEEIKAYKDEAGSLYNKFTTQAKKFMTERTVDGGSPVEQVGQKTDKYVAQVAKLRQDVGKQMGKIENASENVQVPFTKSPTVQNFVLETADAIKNGFKYGPNSGITPEVTKLSEDILRLEKSGSSVKDTLNMTRKWATYLEDQKDKFGDFVSNKSANVQIQNVIRSMKNDARSVLADNNNTYKTLVQGYAKTSKFGEEAKRLMGQEGLYGDSIKGAATVKRAIQSNSDAGARQFLKTLRDITGYDAIKEGDIALKAMKDVGDYQGLSLLNVINDVKGGVLGTTKNVIKRAITPSEAKKTVRYINKDTSVK